MSETLTLEGVHTHIGRYHILQGVDFDAPAGETTMLLGRNGARQDDVPAHRSWGFGGLARRDPARRPGVCSLPASAVARARRRLRPRDDGGVLRSQRARRI